MSFGVVQSAITVIKNNRKLLSKRTKLKNTLVGDSRESLEFRVPNATPKVIKSIQNKIKRENRLRQVKIYTVFSILCIILVISLIYIL